MEEFGTVQWLGAFAALEKDLSSQHSLGGSQPSLTPVPRDLVPSFGLCRYQARMEYMHTCKQTLVQNKVK